VRLLGQDLVLWRHSGRAVEWLDLCIHRGARLSLGRVTNGELVCPYHGWRYDLDGTCTLLPAQPKTPIPARACAETYHC
ncbi:Rieske 2Fe-2S domain-containing protein, partial [Acinetobacter baumannii]